MWSFRALSQLLHSLLVFTGSTWARDLDKVVADYPTTENGGYPTDFTRDITPKPIHSHNDYWRKAPFYQALSIGAISVEADVWHFPHDSTLYVGHDISSLTHNRTLSRMYISPILSLLARQNPTTDFTNHSAASSSYNGVFDAAPEQTLHLYIDLKTDAVPTFRAILEHLEPLQKYLTHYNTSTSTLVQGPVTVILTGNAPFADIAAHAEHNVFYDAPLLEVPHRREYNESNVLFATAPFQKVVGRVRGDKVSHEMREKVRKQIGEAHKRGVKVRYWDTPGWPVAARRAVWRCLVEEGVDLLGVDELEEAAGLF